MSVARFHHSSGWFADVPTECHSWLSQTSTISVSVHRHEEPKKGPYVQLSGRVISITETDLVMSMNGLIVSVPLPRDPYSVLDVVDCLIV